MRAFSFIVHFIGELGGHKTLPTLKNKNHNKIKLSSQRLLGGRRELEKRTSCEKQKQQQQQQQQKLLDVGAQNFAVLEWYSYYGKKIRFRFYDLP